MSLLWSFASSLCPPKRCWIVRHCRQVLHIVLHAVALEIQGLVSYLLRLSSYRRRWVRITAVGLESPSLGLTRRPPLSRRTLALGSSHPDHDLVGGGLSMVVVAIATPAELFLPRYGLLGAGVVRTILLLSSAGVRRVSNPLPNAC